MLVDPEGNHYYGGLTDLRVVSNTGRTVSWPLPPIACGSGAVTLVRANDGKLFLFNQPGRVLRINVTPGFAAPFKIEATFTQDIPSVDDPTRIWLDPAGRIDMAWGNHATVLFPKGYIPPEIKEKMLEK